MTTSSGSLGFLSILQGDRRGQRAAPSEPSAIVLQALRRMSSVPLTDVVKLTALQPKDALDAIEKLRAQGLAEVVETTGEGGGVRLLRLTPAGYTANTTTR